MRLRTANKRAKTKERRLSWQKCRNCQFYWGRSWIEPYDGLCPLCY